HRLDHGDAPGNGAPHRPTPKGTVPRTRAPTISQPPRSWNDRERTHHLPRTPSGAADTNTCACSTERTAMSSHTERRGRFLPAEEPGSTPDEPMNASHAAPKLPRPLLAVVALVTACAVASCTGPSEESTEP